jgi:inner membrane protein
MPDVAPELLWLIVGLVFLFLEFVVPGVVLVFFGLGAFLTAALVWLGVLDAVTGQLLCFAGVSLILLFSLRRYVSRYFRGKVAGLSEYDDAKEFKGRLAKVSRAIRPNSADGRILFDGSEWKAVAAKEIAEGATVKITGKKNITFFVVPGNETETEQNRHGPADPDPRG